jgi:hypothetical protein
MNCLPVSRAKRAAISATRSLAAANLAEKWLVSVTNLGEKTVSLAGFLAVCGDYS